VARFSLSAEMCLSLEKNAAIPHMAIGVKWVRIEDRRVTRSVDFVLSTSPRRVWLPVSKALLFRFQSQELGYRLPVNVDVLRTNLIALNLDEGSPWISDGPTSRRRAVH
jgi:hypothetical protein